MSNSHIEKELWIETPNAVGITGKLTHIIADEAHANITALWGGVINGKGNFSVITDNNKKVTNVLQNTDFKNFQERDVLIVKVPNQSGACSSVAEKLGSAGIGINYIYATTIDNETAVIVSTQDDQQALSVLG